MTQWLKARILVWLGVGDDVQQAISNAVTDAIAEERRRTVEDMESVVDAFGQTNSKMADAARTIVSQLNHNTATLQRWAHESESLRHIEERHKRKGGIELVNGNGKGQLILPDRN